MLFIQVSCAERRNRKERKTSSSLIVSSTLSIRMAQDNRRDGFLAQLGTLCHQLCMHNFAIQMEPRVSERFLY